MKYKLIKPVNEKYTALQQVLTNRGIAVEDIPHYCNTTDEDINSPLLFGEEVLRDAAAALVGCIRSSSNAAVIVDADADGYTSSALLINYLNDIWPTWVTNHLTWYLHDGKQHGLSDYCDLLEQAHYNLVIIPDAGSNDYTYHERLSAIGTKIIILDHHEADEISPYAIVINNQLSDYPNKQLSGVGVTWQFCRYIDSLLGKNYADQYLDLVALGLTADMQSMLSLETKHLINKGFEPDNIRNPFIYSMWQKNKFKLGEHITSWGAAFYIAPFVNAIVRSGTQEEKEIVFKSMLNKEAFQMILSTKRGHRLGEQEQLVEQALRVCTNVKNRQTRIQDDTMQFLESKIETEHLLDNKILLLLVEPGQVDRNVAGLVANKFMAKYQRPCCILTKVEEPIEIKTYVLNDPKGNILATMTTQISYQGSARGCDKVGVTEFKDICAGTGLTMYVAGHQGAFGLGLRAQDIPAFIQKTNEALKDMSDEALYYVDYIYEGTNVNAENILDMADMDSYIGKDIDEPKIAIHNLKVTKDMVTLMSPDKTPTLKIMLPNKVALIKFGSSQEEYDKLATDGYVTLDIVGSCNRNEYNGWVNAQIFMEDYEIVDSCKYYF